VEIFEDEEGVIVGPHASLERRWSLDDLERKVYEVLMKEKRISLSQLWRRFDCHLWELVAALNRLKKKGLIMEENLPFYPTLYDRRLMIPFPNCFTYQPSKCSEVTIRI